jgi:glutamate racemase
VFDSGVGGLSVLRALLAELPHERFSYFADNAHAPYGERGDAYVLARSRAVLQALVAQERVKALVIACNTATTAAVHALRAAYPQLPIIGIEPALKPAAKLTRTGHVGVLATRGTLGSQKLRTLMESLSGDVRFHVQPCDGLADAIEGDAAGADPGLVAARIDQHLGSLGPLGHTPGAIDTVVLGCTHYPLVMPLWQSRIGDQATLLDPAPAVARQTRRVLDQVGLLRRAPGIVSPDQLSTERVVLLASGDLAALQAAARRWLPSSTPPKI